MRTYLPFLAALLIPGWSAAADTASIGRLFSTPAERAGLDTLRQLGEQAAPQEKPVALPLPSPQTEQVTLDGLVRRSSGKNTIWINGNAQNDLESAHGITVLQRPAKSPAISMSLRSGQRFDLKAGQTFDGSSGKISEVYELVPAGRQPVAKE